MTAWTDYVKAYASKHGLKYMQAVKEAGVAYRAEKGLPSKNALAECHSTVAELKQKNKELSDGWDADSNELEAELAGCHQNLVDVKAKLAKYNVELGESKKKHRIATQHINELTKQLEKATYGDMPALEDTSENLALFKDLYGKMPKSKGSFKHKKVIGTKIKPRKGKKVRMSGDEFTKPLTGPKKLRF